MGPNRPVTLSGASLPASPGRSPKSVASDGTGVSRSMRSHIASDEVSIAGDEPAVRCPSERDPSPSRPAHSRPVAPPEHGTQNHSGHSRVQRPCLYDASRATVRGRPSGTGLSDTLSRGQEERVPKRARLTNTGLR